MKKVLMAVAVVAFAASAFAAGPRGSAGLALGGKKVTIEYGRPALKGRAMTELLDQLNEDRMWRAGSEQVTTLHTEGDLLVGGHKLAAGKYSLYLHVPKTGPYALAINKDLGIALIKIWDKAPDSLKNEPWPYMEYAPIAGQEVARVTLQSSTPSEASDLFTIALTPAKDGGLLSLTWGDKSWSTDVKAAK